MSHLPSHSPEKEIVPDSKHSGQFQDDVVHQVGDNILSLILCDGDERRVGRHISLCQLVVQNLLHVAVNDAGCTTDLDYLILLELLTEVVFLSDCLERFQATFRLYLKSAYSLVGLRRFNIRWIILT